MKNRNIIPKNIEWVIGTLYYLLQDGNQSRWGQLSYNYRYIRWLYATSRDTLWVDMECTGDTSTLHTPHGQVDELILHNFRYNRRNRIYERLIKCTVCLRVCYLYCSV